MSAASAARPSYPSASTLTTVWFHILGCDGLGNPGHQAARAFIYGVWPIIFCEANPIRPFIRPRVNVMLEATVMFSFGSIMCLGAAKMHDLTNYALAIIGGFVMERIGRRLVEVAKLGPTPERFPRRPGMAGKRPLAPLPSR